MTGLAVTGVVLGFLLRLLLIALLIRFALDLVQALRPAWRPRGAVLVVAETAYTVTDPPLKAVRRVLPPLRVGGLAVDLAFSVVLLAVVVLQGVAAALERA